MTKKILLLFGLILVLAGCGKAGTNGVVKNSTYEDINYKPTFKELVSTVGANTPYIDVSKEVMSDANENFSEVDLQDFVNLIKGITTTYGSGGYFNSTGEIKIENIAQFGMLANTAASIDSIGPILIIKDATLSYNDKNKTVNLVVLGGTEFKNGQATGIKEDLLSGLNLSNEFLYDSYYAVYDHIINSNDYDKDKPIVIAGYSLGGMVAQQLAALKQISTSFNEIHVVGMAAPILAKDDMDYKNTIVRRIVDTKDIVPRTSIQYLGNDTFQTEYESKNFAVVKEGNTKTFVGSHILQYMDTNLWQDVDALGYYKDLNNIIADKNGMELNKNAQNNKIYNYTLTFDRTQMNWYPAPTVNAAQK